MDFSGSRSLGLVGPSSVPLERCTSNSDLLESLICSVFYGTGEFLSFGIVFQYQSGTVSSFIGGSLLCVLSSQFLSQLLNILTSFTLCVFRFAFLCV